MFVRFQQHRSRLSVSLIRAHRVHGKPRAQHVAGLGGVPLGGDPHVATRERARMWQRLHEAIADLPSEQQVRLTEALHARVPLPTEEERAAAELARAEHDAAFWDQMHGHSIKQAESYQQLAALASERAAVECELANRAKAERLANYKVA
jgi:hypothetical protein